MIADPRAKILLVDDDPALRESLQLVLKSEFEVLVMESGTRAAESLSLGEDGLFSNELDLLLLDVMMPGIDGIELLKQVKSKRPGLPVIMVSASTVLKTGVEAMKLGAVDFINKPFHIEELIERVREAINNKNESDLGVIEESISTVLPLEVDGDFGCLVGSHPVMLDLYKKIEQVAPRRTTVLITGESGTGKELVARELHRASDRRDEPFVAINCAAIPESLVESELFGHEKGAFTHAVEKRLGHFELADGGTIFLDEIGELSLAVQVKLLRVLQEREFYRIGRSRPVQVDIRLIAATNRNLEHAISEGTFRQDLFYRVNVVGLELPPLRKRSEDVERLTNFFIEKLSRFYSDKHPKVSSDVLEVFRQYPWPGNVRELENVIESILALSSSEEISLNDIPARIRALPSSPESLSDAVVGGILPFEEAERQFETEIITRALEKTQFVQTKAAELLGISRRILKYKMDKLGIHVDEVEE